MEFLNLSPSIDNKQNDDENDIESSSHNNTKSNIKNIITSSSNISPSLVSSPSLFLETSFTENLPPTSSHNSSSNDDSNSDDDDDDNDLVITPESSLNSPLPLTIKRPSFKQQEEKEQSIISNSPKKRHSNPFYKVSNEYPAGIESIVREESIDLDEKNVHIHSSSSNPVTTETAGTTNTTIVTTVTTGNHTPDDKNNKTVNRVNSPIENHSDNFLKDKDDSTSNSTSSPHEENETFPTTFNPQQLFCYRPPSYDRHIGEMFQFAFVYCFIYLFKDHFKFPPKSVSIEELEESILSDQPSPLLSNILHSFLSNLNKSRGEHRIEQDIRNLIRTYQIEKHKCCPYLQHVPYEQGTKYFSLHPVDKLMILNNMVDWQLMECTPVRDYIESLNVGHIKWNPLLVEPSGKLKTGEYIYKLPGDKYNVHLYKGKGQRDSISDPIEKWSVITKTIHDVKEFMESLDQSNKHERALHQTLSESILPKAEKVITNEKRRTEKLEKLEKQLGEVIKTNERLRRRPSKPKYRHFSPSPTLSQTQTSTLCSRRGNTTSTHSALHSNPNRKRSSRRSTNRDDVAQQDIWTSPHVKNYSSSRHLMSTRRTAVDKMDIPHNIHIEIKVPPFIIKKVSSSSSPSSYRNQNPKTNSTLVTSFSSEAFSISIPPVRKRGRPPKKKPKLDEESSKSRVDDSLENGAKKDGQDRMKHPRYVLTPI